jgi:hypothetical protein
MPSNKEPTRVEAFLNWLQTHKLLSVLVIVGICVIALAKFLTSLHDMFGFFRPAQTTPVATSPLQPTQTPLIPESPARSLSPSVFPSATPLAPSPSVANIGFSPVTFAEILRVESDNTLTELQKDEFFRKHEGKIVEWTGRVFVVRRAWEDRADSEFHVAFRLPDSKDLRVGEPGIATFPASLRDDMVDLQAGDIIRFRGVLGFVGGAYYTVVVRNCQLLEHHK